MPRLLSRPTTRRRGLRLARPALGKPLLGDVLVIFPGLCVALLSRPSSLVNGLLVAPGLLDVVLAILRGLFAVPLSRASSLVRGLAVFFSTLVLMVLLIVVLVLL